jgi:hypothetical protein
MVVSNLKGSQKGHEGTVILLCSLNQTPIQGIMLRLNPLRLLTSDPIDVIAERAEEAAAFELKPWSDFNVKTRDFQPSLLSRRDSELSLSSNSSSCTSSSTRSSLDVKRAAFGQRSNSAARNKSSSQKVDRHQKTEQLWREFWD